MATKEIKVTPTQAEVLARATQQYAQAQADFETWFTYSAHCSDSYEKPDYTSFEEAVEDRFRWLAMRDRPYNQEGYIAEYLEAYRDDYNKHRQGIVTIKASSSTLRALEKKGLIEILEDGKRGWDTIKLLYV